jgi:hypothetical protein
MREDKGNPGADSDKKKEVLLSLTCALCGWEWEKSVAAGSGRYEPECPNCRKRFVFLGSAKG